MSRLTSIETILEFFTKLSPFKTEDDIPSLPKTSLNVWKESIVPNLIRCGAIPKSELVIGHTYIGSCRNSNEAKWNGEDFEYTRYKFGTSFIDHINHFEDDDGYDLFVPLKDADVGE